MTVAYGPTWGLFFTGPEWLCRLNGYRWMAHLPPVIPHTNMSVTEDPTLSTAAQALATYELQTLGTIDHNPPDPSYRTTAGECNLYASSDPSAPDIAAIDAWMAEVFHGVAMIDPLLMTVGLGIAHDSPTTPAKNATVRTIVALNVLHNRSGTNPASLTNPIAWPANGQNSNLSTYFPEAPDARTVFGYTGIPSTWPAAGLPIFLLLGQANVPSGVTGTLTLNGTQNVTLKEIDETNYTNPDNPTTHTDPTTQDLQTLGRNILAMRGAVVLLPQAPLTTGIYTVTITVPGRPTPYQWVFGVGVWLSAPNTRLFMNYAGPPTFTIGQPAQGQFTVMNGIPPYTFTADQLMLTRFSGMSVSSTGVFSGTPTGNDGTGFSFTGLIAPVASVVTDSVGNAGYGVFGFSVVPAPTQKRSGPSPAALPDGSLIKAADQPMVYVVCGGAKFWIPNPTVFTALGFNWNAIQILADADIAAIGGLPQDGTLLKEQTTAPVYVMRSGSKCHILSSAGVVAAGGWDRVRVVPDGALANILNGNDIP